MPIKIAKSTTNGRRGSSFISGVLIGKTKIKGLTKVRNQKSGRNNSGKITVAHRGGGSKRFYRLVDFVFNSDCKATVLEIHYDPNRSANIALIETGGKEYKYILAPAKIKVGSVIESGSSAPIKIGNRMPISKIPVGTEIHNIEIVPGKGGKICRSAGNFAILLGVEPKTAHVKMPSGEVRKVLSTCWASIGAVGNQELMNVNYGKAGRIRNKGIRPTVRGKAKNVVDHPHGGGEGGTSIGLKYPKTPWGLPTLGYRTRDNKKYSKKMIIKRRSR